MIVDLKSKNREIKKCLYLVSTPIGNLGDISYRAVEILKRSDYILCEDTRVSKILLSKYKISSKLISNHKFNEKKNLGKVIQFLDNGLIVSLVSDAGTPGISDPGAILVSECVRKNIEVIPIPGSSAVISAVAVSGFSEKFFFYGFFPEKKKIILEDLESLSNLNSSIVFFISAKKLNKAIPFIKEYFQGRKILICREMSKIYEEFLRFDVDELKLFEDTLRGEITVVISEKLNKITSQSLSESDKRNIKKMINKLGVKEIVNLIGEKSKIQKKEIYNYCLKIKNEN